MNRHSRPSRHPSTKGLPIDPRSISVFVDGIDDDSPTARAPMEMRPASVARTGPPAGRICVLLGCKGGVGATTLAVNLAAAMAPRAPRGVVLVDLDLRLGDVLCSLPIDGVEGRATVAELMMEIDELPGAALRRRLAVHPSGVHVLSQGHAVEPLRTFPAEPIIGLLRGLARHFDCVIVDGLRDFSDVALAAFDAATDLLLITTEDMPAVRGAGRAVTCLRELGYATESIALVLSRHERYAALSSTAICEALGLPLAATVSNDPRAVARAVYQGAPLLECAPRARVTRDITALAELLRRARGGDQTASRALPRRPPLYQRVAHAIRTLLRGRAPQKTPLARALTDYLADLDRA